MPGTTKRGEFDMEEKIYIGAGYYPDHWPRERWPKDIAMMKEAGIKVLRLAELSWSFLEPTDGEFDFTWLDEFMEMASKEGIQFMLSTPFEASPPWLRKKHPEIVRTDNFGRIHGARGLHCKNNKTFIHYVDRLTNKMAAHYANHESVIGWQIDNELRNVECYCPDCREGFIKWLQDRYGTLEKLNETWGTKFWSQVYNSWDEVTPPSADQLTISISQKLDFTRFGSDSTVNHVKRQVDILKKHAPHQFVTHNTMGWYERLNYYDLAKDLDFIGWDCYPSVDGDPHIECFINDHHRSTKHKAHWILEQKNGYFNYSDYNLAIEPGLVRLWSYLNISRGANGILYYRWRSNRYSNEQNPNGLLRHDGSPRRAYFEAKQITNELAKFGDELASTTVEAPVALFYDYDQIWAFDAHKQYRNFDHRGHMLTYYRALAKMGITADLCAPTTDLSKYKVVIAPSMAMVSDEIYENLKIYVENGGCLIIGARSGFKDWANVTIDEPWPGKLAEMAGLMVDEFEVLPDRYANKIAYNGKEYSVKVWLDMLETNSAESLATYKEKFYAGRTAVAKNKYGKGMVYYVGVMGSDEFASDFLRDVAEEQNVDTYNVPKGIFASSRINDNVRYTFYINNNREQTTVPLKESGYDVIAEKEVAKEAVINGLGVLIVKSV
ncbi:beta-galactosidase [Lederbergia graminis]|uniref:Beta-galactosidase n=1 Tax=Lederbergia graminis TaxID=735518 RepID=A0ABW0LNJ4_9BACI